MEQVDVIRYSVFLASILLTHLGSLAYRGRESGVVYIILKISGYSVLALLAFYQPLSTLQLVLLLTTIILSTLISLFSIHYSHLKYGARSLAEITDLLAVTIIMTFASRYLLELILFWLATELIGFIAIAYDAFVGINSEAMRASLRYLVFSMIPTDIALFVMLALAGFERMLTQPLITLTLDLSSPVVTTLVTLGFMSKAAIAPLHFWLPDAHSLAPSPISALLSGIMIKMGVYGITILTYYTVDVTTAYTILLIFSSLTALYGGLQAVYQRDLKRLLAYSSISHMGAIVMLAAIYLKTQDLFFFYAIIAYIAAHAAYKASLFMDTGVIELIFHEKLVDKLGYIYRVLPVESLAAIFSILSILGIPPTVGFLAKIWAFSSILHEIAEESMYFYPLIVLSVETALSIAYSAKYLQAHIRPGFSGEVEVKSDVIKLSRYVLVASLTSLILALPLLSTQSSEVKVSIDIIVLYLVSLPIILLTFTSIYMLIREVIRGREYNVTA